MKSVSQLLNDEQKQSNFWPLETWLWLSTLLIYLVIYAHFHEWNQSYKVTDSSCSRNYWCLTRGNKMSVPAVLLTVAETLDTLHKLEQKWEIKEVTVYSFNDWGQELLNMPSCVKYSVLRHLVHHIKTKHYNVWCLFLNLFNDTSSAVYVYDVKWL
jgi:hypothetical protein